MRGELRWKLINIKAHKKALQERLVSMPLSTPAGPFLCVKSWRYNMLGKPTNKPLFTEEDEPATKGETKGEYVRFLSRAIKNIIESGHQLPVLKKATGSLHPFQFRGHIHIADALQGYWERNNKVYAHRAKSDYRALYLGTILILEEEQILGRHDNKDEISKLQVWIEQKKSKHAILKKMSLLRSEVVNLLTEEDNEVISEADFRRDIQELIETFDGKNERNKFAAFVDRVIEEESVKLKNRKRQRKHREFEKLTKGIQSVE
jgi:hypothetical protein